MFRVSKAFFATPLSNWLIPAEKRSRAGVTVLGFKVEVWELGFGGLGCRASQEGFGSRAYRV